MHQTIHFGAKSPKVYLLFSFFPLFNCEVKRGKNETKKERNTQPFRAPFRRMIEWMVRLRRITFPPYGFLRKHGRGIRSFSSLGSGQSLQIAMIIVKSLSLRGQTQWGRGNLERQRSAVVLPKATIDCVSISALPRNIHLIIQPKADLNNCVFSSFFGTFLSPFSSQQKGERNVQKITILELLHQNV